MAKMILVRRTIEIFGVDKDVEDQLAACWLQPGEPKTMGTRQEEVERVVLEVDKSYALKLEKDYRDREGKGGGA